MIFSLSNTQRLLKKKNMQGIKIWLFHALNVYTIDFFSLYIYVLLMLNFKEFFGAFFIGV